MNAEDKLKEAREAYYAIQRPQPPRKPGPARNPSADAALIFAQALKEYEKQEKEYKGLVKNYNHIRKDAQTVWEKALKAAHMPDASDGLFNFILGEAMGADSVDGLGDIEDEVYRLSVFAEKVLIFSKKED
jgi:hypothetical protein